MLLHKLNKAGVSFLFLHSHISIFADDVMFYLIDPRWDTVSMHGH